MQHGRDTGSDAHGGHGLILLSLETGITDYGPKTTLDLYYHFDVQLHLRIDTSHPKGNIPSHRRTTILPLLLQSACHLGIGLELLTFALPGCGLPWLRLVAGVFVLCVAQLIRHLVHETLLCNPAS